MALSSSHIQALDDILAKNDRVVGYSEDEHPELGADGQPTGNTGIRLYVDDLVAAKGTLPDDVAGKRVVDVVEIGRPQRDLADADVTVGLGESPRKEFRPLIAGISVGPARAGTGTLGYFARIARTREVCLLTSAHVLKQVDNEVIQPGRADGGKADDERVAKVSAALDDTDLGVDAGVAKIARGVDHRLTINDIGGPITGAKVPVKDDRVRKSGRTTGVTTGTVKDPHATIEVDGVPYKHQIVITGDGGQFSDHGDSGSLIVTASGYDAVGLHMARTKEGSIANPIAAVLDALGVTLA